MTHQVSWSKSLGLRYFEFDFASTDLSFNIKFFNRDNQPLKQLFELIQRYRLDQDDG